MLREEQSGNNDYDGFAQAGLGVGAEGITQYLLLSSRQATVRDEAG